MLSFFKNNPETFYYLNFIFFVFLGIFALFSALWCGYQFTQSFHDNFVASEPELGLPRYYGSCSGLVDLTYTALKNNHDLLSHLDENNNRNKLNFKLKVVGVIANAFTYASNCQDANALGLLLTSDANVTLDAGFNQLMPLNEAVPLARSYFREAESLGYYNNHRMQGLLLQYRIQRNAFRVTIKAPF
jgi:hypothetical protein